MNDRLRKLPVHPTVALAQRRSELVARGVRVVDFGSGDAQEPAPAFAREALADPPAVSARPQAHGQDALRAAAAEYLQRRFGVCVDPVTEVLPTLGSQEAIFHLPLVLVQVPSDKDLVLYGEPADPVYEIGALFAEAWTYAVPLAAANGYRMDPDLVPESVLRRAAVVHLNSPHDPTGQCLPDALFAAWVAARDRYGFTLVGDEGHADLWYAEPRPRSLLEFGRKGCVAVHSLSARSAMAGFRSGFVAGDAEVLATYSRYRTAMGTAPQDFVQVAAAAAWRDTAHVEARRLLCGEKRRIVLDLLAARGLRVLPATASLFLWVEVPQGQTDVAYAERCAEKGILVAPGSYFGRGQERFVRVALGPTIEDCRAAADLWPR